jgi:hypothetical protein
MKRQRTDQIVICDSDSTPDKDLDLAALDVRDRRRGYFKCVHHHVIKRDGEIEHGHRHHSEPAMGLGKHNGFSVSVCLVGGQGEPSVAFTRAQLASLKDLIEELQEEYPDARLTYHHEVDRKVADRGLDLMALAKDLSA